MGSRLRGAGSRLGWLTHGISAGARSDGGCGGDFRKTDLAGNLAGSSGGLQIAAATEEELTAADKQGGNVSSNKTGTTGSSTRNSTGIGGAVHVGVGPAAVAPAAVVPAAVVPAAMVPTAVVPATMVPAEAAGAPTAEAAVDPAAPINSSSGGLPAKLLAAFSP